MIEARCNSRLGLSRFSIWSIPTWDNLPRYNILLIFQLSSTFQINLQPLSFKNLFVLFFKILNNVLA